MENIENGILTLLFENNEVKIRTINSEPYFDLENVCEILEIENPRRAKARLDERGIHTILNYMPIGFKETNFISETNLYRLIFKLASLKNTIFVIWLKSEVLPIFIQDKVVKKLIKDLEEIRNKDLKKLIERNSLK